MLSSVLLILGVAVMMFTISPLLAFVALTTVPVSILIGPSVPSTSSPSSSSTPKASSSAALDPAVTMMRVAGTSIR